MEVMEESQKIIRLFDENTGTWRFVTKENGPTKSMEIIEGALRKLGLSKNEIRVYLNLARFRERKASEISEALNLHRTETYRILRDLEKRGLVSSVFEKPLKFIATPFEQAIDALIEAKKLRIERLEKRKQELIDVWLSLPQPEHEQMRKEVFQILEGEEQIDLKSNEIIQNVKKEIAVFASEEDLPRFYHSGFTDKLRGLLKKNISVKLLTTESAKSRFFGEKIRMLNKINLPTYVKDVPTFILSDEGQLLFMIRKSGGKNGEKSANAKRAALWTNYESFTKTLSALFMELWSAQVPLAALEEQKQQILHSQLNQQS